MTKEVALATTIALELVKAAGYIQQPVVDSTPSLALRSGSSLLLLIPSHELKESEVAADLQAWYDKLTAKELPGITTVDLLYCLATPSPHLKSQRKRRKAAFVGGHSVHVDFVDTSDLPKTLGSLDKNLSNAIKRGQQSYSKGRVASFEELQEAIAESMVSHLEFSARLKAVTPVASYAILGVCLSLFGWGTLVGGTEDSLTLLRFGANYAPLTQGEGEWWRLYGSTFLHIGVVHLLCNMLALLTVGLGAERIYGTVRYLALYSLAGFCGSLASVLTGQSVAAGASGALFGVFGAILVLSWRFQTEWPAAYRRSMFKGMLPMLGYNLLYGFSNAGIDNAAHLGGLLAGTLFALLVRPQALQPKPSVPALRVAMLAVGVLPFLCLVWVVRSVSVTSVGFEGFPQKLYSDASGDLTVRLPALFLPKTENGESFLAGPGMVVVLKKLDELNTVTVESPLFLEGISQAPGTESVKTQKFDGRTWALRDGREGETLVRQGFVYLGAMGVKIEVDVVKAQSEQGSQLRQVCIETVTRKSYDRRVNGEALAKMGLHARALEELATVEDSSEVSLARAKSLLALARYSEAKNILDRLQSQNSKNPEVASACLDLWQKQRDYKQALKALQSLQKALSDSSEQPLSLAYKAALLDKSGDTAGAQKLYQQVRAAEKGDRTILEAEIANSQAWALVLKGRHREALPLVERSLKIQENSGALDTRGRANLELGEYQKAKLDYQKILNENINEPYANYAWARIAQQEGNKELARTFYFRYLALAGENSEFAKDALEQANQLQP